jgi:hypothetical protein
MRSQKVPRLIFEKINVIGCGKMNKLGLPSTKLTDGGMDLIVKSIKELKGLACNSEMLSPDNKTRLAKYKTTF